MRINPLLDNIFSHSAKLVVTPVSMRRGYVGNVGVAAVGAIGGGVDEFSVENKVEVEDVYEDIVGYER